MTERPAGPDFVVIGWKKTGTTSLMSWLGGHPGVHAPPVKEPAYFSHRHRWGRARYLRQLGLHEAAPGRLVGDGSTSYADPRYARRSARRLGQAFPTAKLIAIHRDPFARLLSHYRHEVRRARRPAVPLAAVAADLDVDDVVVRNSRYRLGLEPFIEHHPGALLLLETEQLRDAGWASALSFLGLDQTPAPGSDANVGSASVTYRFHHHRAMRALDRARRHVPRPLARLARPLLVRDDDVGVDRTDPAEVEALLTPAVVEILREEYAWIRERTGVSR